MATERKKFTSIDEYIKSFPEEVRVILEKIRQGIHKEAPDAIETIGYQMPAFKQKGRVLVYFAAWKYHIGFYPTPSGTVAFKKELSQYKSAKGSVKFPIDKPIPFDLIEKIVEFRVKENANRK